MSEGVFILGAKKAYRDKIEELHGTWIGIVCGLWFDSVSAIKPHIDSNIWLIIWKGLGWRAAWYRHRSSYSSRI
jgi:hypothetical protein